ncbi:MAG: AI-2E family transporter [Ruminococcaceae bacterium]|nr:AI-2E family transporter [Oscillospiraceae bacterium]
MKHFIKKNKQSILLYSLVAVIAIAVYFLFLKFHRLEEAFRFVLSILSPFLIGFSIAYLLNPVMVFFERTIYKKIGVKSTKEGVSRLKRTCSICTTYVLVFATLIYLIVLLIPQVVETVESLIVNVPTYFQQMFNDVTVMFEKNDWDIAWLEQMIPYETLSEYLNVFLNSCFGWLVNVPMNLTVGFTNVIVGFFVSVYFLFDKEQFLTGITKVLYAFVKKEKADKVMAVSRLTDKTLSGFIVGKIVDSFIIGLISFPFMLLIYPPYALLISVIIGVTNVIPFFGPFIGAIPSAILILLVAPDKCLWFIIFVLVLQQFDGNVLGPKILGESTGISPIWVLFGIMAGSKILGFAGMILGVPFTAVAYTLFKNYVDKKHQEKNTNELKTCEADS